MNCEYQLRGIEVPESYLGGDMELAKDFKMSWSVTMLYLNVSERIQKLFETCLRSGTFP